MATNDIHVSVTDNNASASVRVSTAKSNRSLNTEGGSPYYVGAEAKVENIENGARITCKDKHGTTTAEIHNGEKGEKGDPGTLPLYSDTTANWNAQPMLLSEAGAMYVYTDHAVIGGQNVAGIKLGDGTSYLIDIPFIDAEYHAHAENTDIHITAEERTFWNNKERSIISGENLILTKL